MSERNEPCPCGSGKRYKQCCGRLVGDFARQESATPIEDFEPEQERGSFSPLEDGAIKPTMADTERIAHFDTLLSQADAQLDTGDPIALNEAITLYNQAILLLEALPLEVEEYRSRMTKLTSVWAPPRPSSVMLFHLLKRR